jgi:glycerol kinase
MEKKYILALDQGTTSCKAILFDKAGKIVQKAQQEITAIFPQPGWVEQNAEEIWEVQLHVLHEAIKGVSLADIAAIGITNQRETTVVWDRNTGKPLHNAVVWQCRRSSEICAELKAKGLEDKFRAITGLVLDPYFSSTKLKWILDENPAIREKAEQGDALFGTIDTWLIWNLTKGRNHVTDYSNASRTMLYNIYSLKWEQEILAELNIPECMLPLVKSSSEVYGYADLLVDGQQIPIAGIAGDQQAALFGQCCFTEGMAKNTYGTGCFILTNTGDKPVASTKGLLTTIAWGLNGKIQYALEGSVFVGGAVIQWLRDGLGLIEDSAESEEAALSVPDTNGVYFVPAFTGLGTPYWNPDARGLITGLTRGTSKAHLIRAALEAIAYQSMDVLKVMQEDSGIRLRELRVDGGAVNNEFLMQFQADMLGVRVVRPKLSETTALGAAYLAGLAVGFWASLAHLQELWELDRVFVAQEGEEFREQKYKGWQKAVQLQM